MADLSCICSFNTRPPKTIFADNPPNKFYLCNFNS
jgi:hypothetical protein